MNRSLWQVELVLTKTETSNYSFCVLQHADIRWEFRRVSHVTQQVTRLGGIGLVLRGYHPANFSP